MVLFTKIRKTNGWTSPKIGNETIPLQQSFKYLGITLDSKLTFKEHIKQKCKSTMKTFFQAKQAIAGTWGLSPKIVKWLYITVIRPRISYGSIIWWERSTFLQEKALLRKTQRLATVSITGAMRTTPNIALDSITGLTPLYIYICAEAMKAYIRMKANKSWIAGPLNGHRFIEHLTKINVPSYDHTTDLIKKTYRFTKNYNILDEHESADTNPEDLTCHTYSTWTNNNDIISGAISNQMEYSENYQFDNRGTKGQGELLAIKNLCRKLNTRPEHTVRIICQHMETLKHLSIINTKSKLTLDTIDKLNETSKNKVVTIQLRTSHTPLPTKTDQTELRQRYNQGNESVGSSYKEITKHIDVWTEQNNKAQFEAYPGARSTKENIGNPYSTKLKNLCERTRKDLRMITQVLTGHSWLNKHMNKIKIRSTPLCPLCKTEEETTAHFIYTCPQLQVERESIFGMPNITPDAKPIKDMDHNKIIAYCKASKRFDEPDES